MRWDRLLTAGSGGLLAIVFLAVVSAGGFAGRGAQASVDASHASAFHEPRHAQAIQSAPRRVVTFKRIPGPATARCRPVGGSSGYVNPLAGDVLRGERIDQGVDYAGTGTLRALGTGRVTYVGTEATGWPGAFVEYRLLAGPDAGCFVYYAEGITPVAGLHPGLIIHPGQRLAGIIPGWPTGIELGWGAGASTRTYAARAGKWSPTDDANNVASAAGKSFSGLIAALGGPGGKVEG
ncbi:MAG TPA: hypothetical protein VFN87_07985 [Solirubrobacteraceae bacterium]|nr:hypothetical protein [Solirubrobacteraceae bacterium]